MSDYMSLELPADYPFKGPTTASCIIHALGLSQADAAVFFSVRRDTIKKWQSGKMRMPDDLLDKAFRRLDLLMHLASEIAHDYEEQAQSDDASFVYIGLPTEEQMRRGMLPRSKGFYETFFGMIMARADGISMAVCEPSDDMNATNLWIPRLLEEDVDWSGVSLVDEDDYCVRADHDFYRFLREQLASRNFSASGVSEATWEWTSGGPFLDIPYLPEWLGEAYPELTDAQLSLLDTQIRLKIPGYCKTTELLRSDSEATIFFVGPDGIVPVLDATEGPEDADANALNAALADIIEAEFGTMDGLWKAATHVENR